MEIPIIAAIVMSIASLVVFGIGEQNFILPENNVISEINLVIPEPELELAKGVSVTISTSGDDSTSLDLSGGNGSTGPIDIIVVGVPTVSVADALSNNATKERGIHYHGYLAPATITASLLDDYDVVLLQGDPYFDMNARTAIGSFVENGGSLIVTEDTGSKHKEYKNVAGWSWPVGEGIPVPAMIVGEWEGISEIANASEIMIRDYNHPIAKGIKIKGIDLGGNRVFKTVPQGSGEVIMIVNTTEGYVPAVIASGMNVGGAVAYFSYDPGITPGILLNAVEWTRTP